MGTVHDFFIMFEHVLRHPPWLYIVWWSQTWKWKNSVKKKNSGNSVHHLRIYAHVLPVSHGISKHIHLILCLNFVMPSIYFLLFINALMRLLSTALSVLKSHFNRPRSFVIEQLLIKSEKRFVRAHWLQEELGLLEVLWVSIMGLWVDSGRTWRTRLCRSTDRNRNQKL